MINGWSNGKIIRKLYKKYNFLFFYNYFPGNNLSTGIYTLIYSYQQVNVNNFTLSTGIVDNFFLVFNRILVFQHVD